MDSGVDAQVARVRELLAAVGTLVGLEAHVGQHVQLQLGAGDEGPGAEGAFVATRGHVWVLEAQMMHQLSTMQELHRALGTMERRLWLVWYP